MRKLFIFGNGLGMAIAPDEFNLNAVMSSAWTSGQLTETQKKLMLACLPDGAKMPTSEEQLAKLQEIVAACEVLLGIPPTKIGHWLSQHGQDFPNAVQQFGFEVARRMFVAKHSHGENIGKRCCLPEDFASSLANRIIETQSHVATLNYDGLLSSAFGASNILHNDNTLRDGFVDQKFDKRNMFRHKEKGGWYLHLHGCPLFVDRDKSRPHKLSPESIEKPGRIIKNVGRHIVLTHVTHKKYIISASEILTTYWEFLKRALDESEEIMIFGYSGNDTHLNQLIAQKRGSKLVRVVEWLGAGFEDIRGPFWANQLGGEVNLILKEDVLTFRDW